VLKALYREFMLVTQFVIIYLYSELRPEMHPDDIVDDSAPFVWKPGDIFTAL